MKIVRVFPTFQNDFKYTEHYLAKELKIDNHFTVFVTSDKYLSSWDKYLTNKDGVGTYCFEDYEVVRLSSYFPAEKAIFKNWNSACKIIFDKSVDVIHILGVGTFTTMLVLFFSLFKKRPNHKIIISDHTDKRTHIREGFTAELYYGFFGLLFKLLGSKVTTIVTFSDGSVEILCKRFGLKKDLFRVIPLGYDQDIFRFQPEFESICEKFVIGFAGKIDSKKKVDFLLNTLKKFRYAENIHVRIAGFVEDEYGKKLKAIAEKANYTIEFLPFVKSEGLMKFYNSLDLAVFPGSISITTIEASACGVPVIIYNSISNLDERVSHGRGRLFTTEEELLEFINEYYLLWQRNEIKRSQIAKVTEELFSWKKIKNLYLEVYECKN